MGYPNPFLAGIPSRDRSGGGAPEAARLIERFLEGYDSEQTRRAYHNDLTGFFGGEATLEEARAVEIGSVRRYLREEAKEISFQTVRRRASSLKAFFQWLEEEGLAEEDLLAEAPGPAALAREAQKRANGKDPGDDTDDDETDAAEDLSAKGAEDPAGQTSPGEASREGRPSPQSTSPYQEDGSDERRPDGEEGASGGEEADGEGAPIGPVPLGVGPPPEERFSEEPRHREEGSEQEEASEEKSTEPGPDDSRAGPDGEGEGPERSRQSGGEGELGPASPDEDLAGGLSITELLSDTPPGMDPPSGETSTEGPAREKPSPEDHFPEDLLEVPLWAEASLEVQVARAHRFTGEAFEEGMNTKLRSVPEAITEGLAQLADAERFPEGAIERPYYQLTDVSGEWMVTVWRTGGETDANEEGGAEEEGGAGEMDFTFTDVMPFLASGLAVRLTFARPLMDAEKRMEERGEAPALGSDAVRLLWLLQGREWTLTGSLYDLLESGVGLPSGRAAGDPEPAPTKRFAAAGTEEAREAVALEVATLLSKGLGLSKRDEVQIARTTL